MFGIIPCRNNIPSEFNRYTYLGELKPYGEYCPLFKNLSIYIENRQSYFRNIDFEDKFEKYFSTKIDNFLEAGGTMNVNTSLNNRPLDFQLGAYKYSLFVDRGLVIDARTYTPLIVLSVLEEYQDDFTTYNNYVTQIEEEKLTLCVDERIQKSTFLKKFLKLYPYLEDRIKFFPDLHGFYGGIQLRRINGGLLEHQQALAKLFLEEEKEKNEPLL